MSAKHTSKIAPLVKTLTVECTPEAAFHYFTAEIGKWWPLATHSCIAYSSGHKESPASCILEPHPGGRIVERGHSGEEHVWGTILLWEPPRHVCFSWHPLRDEKTAQTVDVWFSPVPEGTQVVLTHDGWENFGKGAEEAREGYSQGWEGVFVAAYAEYVRHRS